MEFYRRRLPHWHPDGATIFLTWGLHGSIPRNPSRFDGRSDREKFAAMDRDLDCADYGPTWLKDKRVAESTARILFTAQNKWKLCELYAWVIMSNHVHALLKPHKPLCEVTRAIKSSSARAANEILGRSGERFWREESYDHWVRNADEFSRIVKYIERNPVKAGLVEQPQDWPWSSASVGQVSDLPSTPSRSETCST